ncbi:prepilin-type N-terminal cleavage/methylation domain-containing protein [Candidatus Gottesmanbacteria bacterium]|nr:prepilin-type N-terminal cleavage/methylation domain-containing protein [Candidatus Gottesmanbacteria bacterium]
MAIKNVHDSWKKQGFTLLEIMVSIGIVAVVGVLISQVFFTTTRSNAKSEVLKNVKQNGDFSLERIYQLVRNATEVTSTCAEGGTSSSSITLTNPDGESTSLGCLLDGTVTRIASVSASTTEYLTDSALTLGGADCNASSLTFVCTMPAGQPATVAIIFSLAQKGTPPDQFDRASASFQTTAAIRNAKQ